MPTVDLRQSKREIGTFLVLLCLLSAIADALIIHAQQPPAMLNRFLMWCPAAAAFATCALCRVPQESLGLRWPASRWMVFAYALPVLYALPVYVAAWAAIAGSFTPGPFLAQTARDYGFAGHPLLATSLIDFPLMATAGIVASLTWALGEEIGWRGFLLPRLNDRIGFVGGCLVSGLIWAVWHYPVLLGANYNAGTDPLYATTCFTVSVVAIAFILGWLRLRTSSVWPCALLHASHNQFIQGLFDPVTTATGPSRLVTTEFGCGLTLTMGIAALLVIRFPRQPAATGGDVERSIGPNQKD